MTDIKNSAGSNSDIVP